MKQEPTYVGIDVANAQVDIAVRPTGQRWVVSYEDTGVGELVFQMEYLDPALVLLEAPGGLGLPLVAAPGSCGAARCGRQPSSGSRLRQGHRDAGEDRRLGRGGPGSLRRSGPTACEPIG